MADVNDEPRGPVFCRIMNPRLTKSHQLIEQKILEPTTRLGVCCLYRGTEIAAV